MEISATLILVLIFAIPAIIQNYAFQYFSRIRRPLEANIIGGFAAILIGAVFIHLVSILGLSRLFPVFTVPNLNALYDITELTQAQLVSVAQYLSAVSVAGFVTGTVTARLTLWRLPLFQVIGRLYYGGLYDVFHGVLAREISVSVLAKDQIDSKAVIYRGTLEDIKLGEQGAIEYLIIVMPTLMVATINKGKAGSVPEESVAAFKERLIGGSLPEEGFASRRLMIEGAEIANVYFEPQAPKATLERFVFDGFSNTASPLLAAILGVLGLAIAASLPL